MPTNWEGKRIADCFDCPVCEGRGTLRKPNWFERLLSISLSICPICSGVGGTGRTTCCGDHRKCTSA